MRVKLPEAHLCIFCVCFTLSRASRSQHRTLYIHSALSSCTNGLRSPIETGRRIPEMHQWDLLLWWSEAGSGQIWKDCCHGDHSSGPKAAVDSQLIPFGWILSNTICFLIYLFFTFSWRESLFGCTDCRRHFVSTERVWADSCSITPYMIFM